MTLGEFQEDIRNQMSEMEAETSLEHAVCGLGEEAGEVLGLLKRQSFKGLAQPRDRWVDELGDVLWYLAATAIVLDVDLEEVVTFNKKKLEERYGPFRR